MSDQLSRAFAALADPTRRDLVARLAIGDATVGELAAPYDVSVQPVSKHLQVLERAGLVERGRDAQRRPCRLVAAPLKEVAGFAEGYRQFWEQSFDRLDDYMQKLQSKGKKHVRKSKQQR
jgi:DNA-binding transcriptional ArsR family regulator